MLFAICLFGCYYKYMAELEKQIDTGDSDSASQTGTTAEDAVGTDVVGGVWYNSVRQSGAQLFLVDNEFNIVSDDVSDSDGAYALGAEHPGGYWLLAGYDQGTEPLMASKRLMLEEHPEPLQNKVELETLQSNEAQELLSRPECYCTVSIWHMTYWSCEMEEGWAWSECD